jgi:hypothetical protein
MPRKSGKATARERVFVDTMAASGDPVYSAHKAQYSHPPSAAVQLMKRPAVVAAVKQRELARVTDELLPLATDRVEQILRDPKENSRVVLQAAKMVWDRTLGDPDSDKGKEPHEMSADELQERISRLRDQQAAIAEQARDVTPEPEQDENSDGAFG